MFGCKKKVGLDIDAHYIRMAEVLFPNHGLPILKNVVIIERVVSNNIQELKKILLKEIEANKIELKFLVANISSPSIQVATINLPAMSGKELAEVIPQQAKKVTPISSGAMIDYIVQKEEKGRREILIVAVNQREVEEHLSLLESLGLKPNVLTLKSLAIINLLRKDSELKNKLIAILEIRRNAARLDIIKDGNLRFSRRLYLDPQNIASDLSSLSSQINQCFSYYQRSSRGATEVGKIDFLFLTGEITSEDLSVSLEKELAVKVKMINPLDYVQLDASLHSKINPVRKDEVLTAPHGGTGFSNGVKFKDLQASLAAAIGLSFEPESSSRINLLPEEVEKKYKPEIMILERSLEIGKWSAMAVFLVLLGVILLASLNLRIYNKKLNEAEVHLAELQPRIEIYDQAQTEKEKFENKISLLEKLEKDIPPLDKIMIDIGSYLPQSAYLEKISFVSPERSLTKFNKSEKDNYLLSLEGDVFGDYESAQLDLNKFCSDLEERNLLTPLESRSLTGLSNVRFSLIQKREKIEVFEKRNRRFKIDAQIKFSEPR